MYNYLIYFTYWQDGRRIREKDLFWGDTAQEAVDNCRAENLYEFSEQFGRIEEVYKEYEDHWGEVEDWE